MTKKIDKKTALLIFVAASLFGSYLIGVSAGWFPTDMNEWHIPRPLIGVLGALLVFAGAATVTQNRPRLNHAFGGLLLLCFAALGWWVGIYSDGNFDGGVPFLPKKVNSMFGRVLFGGGAVITFLFSLYAFKCALFGCDQKAPDDSGTKK